MGSLTMSQYWVDYGFYWLDTTSVQWRFPIAFQCAFALVVLLGVLCLPESPRWLIKKGHYDDAAKVLAQMDNTTEDDVYVQVQLRQLQEAIGDSEKLLGDFSYKELLTNGPEQNFYRTTIAFVAQAFQQLSGINLITYYATTVFLSIIPEQKTARLLTCGNGTEYFAASLVALFLIDTLGRRKLMLGTAALMSISMAILAGTVSVVNAKAEQGIHGIPESYVAAFFLYFFNTCFAFGWLGMTWLYPPEITPIRIRAPASAIATSSNWLFNFLIVMITPVSFSSIGYKTYIIFTVLNLSFIPVIWAFFPETKRRSLEEIDLIFAESSEQAFFKWDKMMTTACHLSLTKKHLTSDELDEELTMRFGDSKTKAQRVVGDDNVEKEKAGRADSLNHDDEASTTSHSGSGSGSGSAHDDHASAEK
jgi:sugar porter (SP) family MFS transporter